jgi:hypothetical protein
MQRGENTCWKCELISWVRIPVEALRTPQHTRAWCRVWVIKRLGKYTSVGYVCVSYSIVHAYLLTKVQGIRNFDVHVDVSRENPEENEQSRPRVQIINHK